MQSRWFWSLVRLGKDEEGATLVEYALLLAFILGVCILSVYSLGIRANDLFGMGNNGW